MTANRQRERRVIRAVLLPLLVLGGCGFTPELKTNKVDMAMDIKSKVPTVHAVRFAPDGRSVVTGGEDRTARLWDLSSAKLTKTFKAKDSIKGLAFTPDGKMIATSYGGLTSRKTTLWDPVTGTSKWEFPGGGEGLSFSSDGRHFVPASFFPFHPNTVKVFSLQTGEMERELGGETGVISPNGRHVAVWDDSWVSLYSVTNGEKLWRKKVADCKFGAMDFSPDGQSILVTKNREPFTSLVLLETTTGNQVKEIGHSERSGHYDFIFHQLAAVAFSPDGRLAMSGDLSARYKLYDISTGSMLREMEAVDEAAGTPANHIPGLSFSPDGRRAIVATLAAAHLFDIVTGQELASLIAFEDGEWLVTTPSGYYNSSEKGDQYLGVTVNGQQYSISQLRESFFRPDLTVLALSGSSLQDFRKVSEVKQPPTVAIVNTPDSVDRESAEIGLMITDTGGGIGDIRLYLNGSAVVLDKSRGVTVVSTEKEGVVHKRYKIKLTAGINTIRAIAFNGENSMQSTDALHTIRSSFKTTARPSLHALAVGINEYTNPKLQLNFAVADARLFADTLRKGAEPLFDKVVVKTLTHKEETTQENIVKELKAMQSLNPDDLFVFYVASHGTVDDGEYFLITSNVGSLSTHKLKADAISQDALKELVANIPATKKLIVIDTCSAGKLGDAIQAAMLTRGMSEDTAMKVLSRAVGSTILSASTSVQEALEGYQGHGLFTYVLSEGLSGKADKSNSGYVKTTELADYVDNEVPAVAEKIFNRAQYPTVSISGMGFPVSQVR